LSQDIAFHEGISELAVGIVLCDQLSQLDQVLTVKLLELRARELEQLSKVRLDAELSQSSFDSWKDLKYLVVLLLHGEMDSNDWSVLRLTHWNAILCTHSHLSDLDQVQELISD